MQVLVFSFSILSIILGSFYFLVSKVSFIHPSKEFITVPERHSWTERIFKERGWNRAILLERSGRLDEASLNYIYDSKEYIDKNPQWAGLSLFNAAICAKAFQEQDIHIRILKLAAVLYEKSLEGLMITLPESAIWTALESARSYRLAGHLENSKRMYRFAEDLQDRIRPLRPMKLNQPDKLELPDPLSNEVFNESNRIIKSIHEEVKTLENHLGVNKLIG